MKRRSFCKQALASGVVISIGGCDFSSSDGKRHSGRPVAAITGHGDVVSIEAAAVNEFAAELGGKLYLPDDPGYDDVRSVWNGMIDKHPAMVAQCTSADDVVRAVTFARERNLLVAVKGGGHSYPGKATCDGGMMIDLSPLHGVTVDADAKTAAVQGGALLGHLDTATLEHGLVTTAGIVSHTGVGGFTLGGGMGRTDRLHGLAIDNLVRATVVTANGDVVRASANEKPDLFWALRGGGGNFGVVTEFVFGLHPFDPTVYGGALFFDFEQARDLLGFWAEFNETLPREANVEPIWFVGEGGQRTMMIEVCYAGDLAVGERVMAPLNERPGRLAGELGAVSYRQMQTSLDATFAHGQQNYLKSGFIIELSDDAIDAIVDAWEGDVLPGGWFQHLGGATADVAPDATAFAHRSADLNLGISAEWQDPAENEERIAGVRRYYAAVEPFMKGFYTNLNEETEEKTWGNFGANYPRLVEVKNAYDPTNLFRLNPNIRPTV